MMDLIACEWLDMNRIDILLGQFLCEIASATSQLFCPCLYPPLWGVWLCRITIEASSVRGRQLCSWCEWCPCPPSRSPAELIQQEGKRSIHKQGWWAGPAQNCWKSNNGMASTQTFKVPVSMCVQIYTYPCICIYRFLWKHTFLFCYFGSLL